jgi:SAM-dependent methyltransferase
MPQPPASAQPTVNLASSEAEAWSRYWDKGLLHACASSFANNHGGAIASFWREQLLKHSKPEQQVIDFGCGNGPIAMLLHDELSEAPRYLGVDHAELRPQWLARLRSEQRARIRFLAPQDFRHLPFEADSADWLVSQFGAEYGDLPLVLPEALRVLKPSGTLLWLIHHEDSLIVGQAKEESAHIDFLRGEGGLLELATALTEPFAMAKRARVVRQLNSNKQLIALRDRYNLCLDDLADRCGKSLVPDILLDTRDWVSQILQGSRSEGAKAAKQRLVELDSLLADSKERLRQLCKVAQSETSIRSALASVTSAASAGTAGALNFELKPLHEASATLAWTLKLAKSN